jgi:DNA invertase Pin-like site-specific DNA recombinase
MIGDPRGEKCAENTVVMLVGYIRVSSESDRQITDLQRDALLAAVRRRWHLVGRSRLGAKDDRLGLNQALTFVRPGDVLVVWKAGSVEPIAVTFAMHR